MPKSQKYVPKYTNRKNGRDKKTSNKVLDEEQSSDVIFETHDEDEDIENDEESDSDEAEDK